MDRALPAARGEPSGAAHQATLERAFGRTFAVFVALMVVVFWSSAATLAGQGPGSIVADLLLSVLLVWQAARMLRRPPCQRDLYVLAATAGVLLLVSRALAAPGSPFLVDDAYLLIVPVAVAWAAWSARFVAVVPILLLVLGTWAWDPSGDLPVEQAGAALATVACTSWAARLLRAGARRADVDADLRSREMAAEDATLAAKEAERRAANAVHDDVLSVLRAVSVAGRQVPWSVVVSKAQAALEALAQQMTGGGSGLADLGPALRRAAESAAELDVGSDIDGPLDVPTLVAEALSAAAGEALRNTAAHAGVRSALIIARGTLSGGVTVTISDNGIGFDPARVGHTSTGLRNSIRARLSDVGGHAEIISVPGQGTSVVLTWNQPQPASIPALDPLDWARRIAPNPQLIFVGFMLPVLLSGLSWLCLHWQDMRWPAVAAAAFGGMLGLAILSARHLSQVRMTRRVGLGLATANIIMAAAGSLAVTPGTTDSYAYWIDGVSGIVIAAVYLIRGPAFGLTSLALDVTALTVGLIVTGRGIAFGAWVSALTSPAIGAGLAAAMLAAFRNLSSRTESQLAEYREVLRLQARAEAISRVDNAALENARRVAGPVLSAVVSSPAPDPDLIMAAGLASATLRDELLAPGFLTAALAERVRVLRLAGASITVNFAGQAEEALTNTARKLLGAVLTGLDAGSDASLQVHPPTVGHTALLILHARSRRSDHAVLRRHAAECGALISDLDDYEVLIRLEPALERTAVAPYRGISPTFAE